MPGAVKMCQSCHESNPNARKKCSRCAAVLVQPKKVVKENHVSKKSVSALKGLLEKRANQIWASHNYHIMVLYFSNKPTRKRCTMYATPGKAQQFQEATKGVFVNSFRNFMMKPDEREIEEEAHGETGEQERLDGVVEGDVTNDAEIQEEEWEERQDEGSDLDETMDETHTSGQEDTEEGQENRRLLNGGEQLIDELLQATSTSSNSRNGDEQLPDELLQATSTSSNSRNGAEQLPDELLQATSTSSNSRKGRTYTQWRTDDEEVVFQYFQAYVKGKSKKKLPGRKEIVTFLEEHREFPHKWDKIRNKLMNEVYKSSNK